MNMYEGSDVLLNERGVEAVNKGTVRAKTATVLPQNHHLNTSQLTVKRMRNWPLLPMATEVKQRRRKERKFILSIWGSKGKKRRGERGNRVGVRREGEEYSTCINNWSAVRGDRNSNKTETDQAYQLVLPVCAQKHHCARVTYVRPTQQKKKKKKRGYTRRNMNDREAVHHHESGVVSAREPRIACGSHAYLLRSVCQEKRWHVCVWQCGCFPRFSLWIVGAENPSRTHSSDVAAAAFPPLT